MTSVSKITWISVNALEAEVTITDGIFEVQCFSQPCNMIINQKVDNLIYCYNNSNVEKVDSNEFKVEKLYQPFAYKMIGKVIDKKELIVRIGDVKIQLEEGSIPRDIEENDYISFYCQRIDIY